MYVCFPFFSLNKLFLKDIKCTYTYNGYHLKRAKIHLVLKLKWFLPRLALQLKICVYLHLLDVSLKSENLKKLNEVKFTSFNE